MGLKLFAPNIYCLKCLGVCPAPIEIPPSGGPELLQDFRLVETTVLRVNEGSGSESSGVFPDSSPAEPPSIYQTKFAKLTITGEPPARTMRLDFFRFGGRLASKNAKSGEVQYIETGVNTDVDVREGQKAVVGKANFGNARESLFIVLAAKIVEQSTGARHPQRSRAMPEKEREVEGLSTTVE